MGVRILYDERQKYATIYCSTVMWSLGPVFYEHDDGTPADEMARKFLIWLGHDPRRLEYASGIQLERKVNDFLEQYKRES